nr:MAG TPA: hypothetical protein [Microviridae sp.]
MEKVKTILKYIITIGGWIVAACKTIVETL